MYKLSEKGRRDIVSKLNRLISKELWSKADKIIPKTFYTPERHNSSEVETYTTLTDARYRAFDSYRQYLADRYLRPAKKEEYERWLVGYLLYNKDPQIKKLNLSWDQKKDSVFVAEKDFEIEMRLIGGFALHIIVPEGVEFLGSLNKLGHTTIHYNKDFTHSGGTLPPVFTDLTLNSSYERLC